MGSETEVDVMHLAAEEAERSGREEAVSAREVQVGVAAVRVSGLFRSTRKRKWSTKRANDYRKSLCLETLK